METYNSFFSSLKEVAKALAAEKNVRIIAHADCDGITAASILVHTFLKKDISYSLTFIDFLDAPTLKGMEQDETLLFLDMGASIIDKLESLSGKVFVIDHHQTGSEHKRVIHLNPELHGLAHKEISTSGIVYLLAKELVPIGHMAGIAVLGAIADSQEDNGFAYLNDLVLQDALKANVMEQRRALRFGTLSKKPLVALVAHTDRVFIPGVSGNEKEATLLLKKSRITIKRESSWTTYADLTRTQEQELATQILARRAHLPDSDDIFGYIYTIRDSDANEFVSMLNACGKLGKAAIGVGVCLGDESAKREALKKLRQYKQHIKRAITWYKKQRGTGRLYVKPGCIILNAKEDFPATLTGTVSSIIARAHDMKEGTIVMVLARYFGTDYTKISLRIAGGDPVNLKEKLHGMVHDIDGSVGGHVSAAGGIIHTKHEDKLISRAREILAQ